MGGVAAPPVQVAPDDVEDAAQFSPKAEAISTPIQSSRSCRQAEPGVLHGHDLNPIAAVTGHSILSSCASSAASVPSMQHPQAVPCRRPRNCASARTDLWPEHSSATMSTCSTWCRHSGDAFMFARDAPSDANRSFMELSSTVCRRPIRAQRVPTRKPLRHPGRTHVHADWHSYCKAAGCP